MYFFSVFGKCLENLRDRFSLSLVHSKEKLKKVCRSHPLQDSKF